jgi:hypothetical protein
MKSQNADYVKTEGFKKLLDGKNHAAVGFVGRQTVICFPEKFLILMSVVRSLHSGLNMRLRWLL